VLPSDDPEHIGLFHACPDPPDTAGRVRAQSAPAAARHRADLRDGCRRRRQRAGLRRKGPHGLRLRCRRADPSARHYARCGRSQVRSLASPTEARKRSPQRNRNFLEQVLLIAWIPPVSGTQPPQSGSMRVQQLLEPCLCGSLLIIHNQIAPKRPKSVHETHGFSSRRSWASRRFRSASDSPEFLRIRRASKACGDSGRVFVDVAAEPK